MAHVESRVIAPPPCIDDHLVGLKTSNAVPRFGTKSHLIRLSVVILFILVYVVPFILS